MPYRVVFLAIAVYLTCDLSSPAVPGAFVFDAAESVDSVSRARDLGGAVLAMSPIAWFGLQPLAEVDEPRAERVTPVVREQPMASILPRGMLEHPPASEDPH